MRWQGRRESGNVEDRRSSGGGMFGGGGGMLGGGMKLGGGGLIIVLIISLLMGRNPLERIGNSPMGVEQTSEAPVQTEKPTDEGGRFVSVVLASTEDVWNQLFQQEGSQYQPPRLVLFRGNTQSGCGFASSATGPFYCPADRKVYIDLSFYDDLHNKLNAPGDFAMAYVIAHEVGHHIQNLLGISDKVQQQRGQVSEAEYNKLSVRLELQADYFAGLWAHYAQKEKDFLEEGDIEEALNAANAIGDDRLQKQSQGHVVPDAFTHGTSEQRVRWFKKGFQSGSLNGADTFNQEI